MTTPNTLTIRHKGHKIMLTIKEKTDITITKGDEEFIAINFPSPARAVKFARRRIKEVMTSSAPFPRPAGMGYVCDSFLPNPAYVSDGDAPLLIHCQNPAAYRMVIQTSEDCYTVKRCKICAGELRSRAFAGDVIEILEDEAIGDVPFDGRPYYPHQPVIDESETYF